MCLLQPLLRFQERKRAHLIADTLFSPLVMLAMSKKLFLASIRDRKFQLVNSYDVNIGGLCGGIYVLQKPCQ